MPLLRPPGRHPPAACASRTAGRHGRVDRRGFLKVTTTVGFGAALAAHPLAAWAGRAPSAATGRVFAPVAAFPSGVLSGDPTADGVVLWTRIDPAVAGAGALVAWEVASDPGFGPGTLLATGSATTDPAGDHTLHIEVEGLGPARTAWYRFVVSGTTSPVGRTRTLPVGAVDHLRIAFFSCQRYVHGYYNAHADLAARALDPATDVDLVLCLGDYVYEAGPADGVVVPGRVDPEAPTTSLDDFRRQYHLYRSDPDLQAMHAAFPVMGIFDNHDGMRDPSDPAGPGAVAAFFEQMPVRRTPGDPDRQHRRVALGDLAEVFLLDERQHRDPIPEQSEDLLGTSTVDQPLAVAPGRTMLGSDQLAWLQSGLSTSTAAWKVLGSQLVFWPFRSEVFPDLQAEAGDGPQRNAGRYLNLIQWDGYQAERRLIVDHLVEDGIEDVVIVSGDLHFWSAAEVPADWDDPDSPYVLTEFGGASISSANGHEQGLPDNDAIRPLLAAVNPLHLRYIELLTNGYGVLDLTPERLTATYVSPLTITERDATSRVLARFEVDRGTARVRQVEGDGFMPRPDDPATAGPGDGDGAEPGEAGRPAAPATPIATTARFAG